MKLLVIHGPNLNLLGQREPSLYGRTTLEALNQEIQTRGEGHHITCVQSNAEHEIIELIQKSPAQEIDCIIINPAGLTHTSVALRDALLAVALPFYEVHLSNPLAREPFRHFSYLSDIAVGSVCGLGPWGYYAALDAALNQT